MTSRPRRVLVLGNSGSGKSTLARRLGPALGLPVVHLDAMYWRPGWVDPRPAEWVETVADAAAADAWVIDGTYSRTLDARLTRADAVVLLDLPRPLCLWRVLARRVRYHGRTRPDMADGCPERITFGFLLWVWRYPRRTGTALRHRLATSADGRPVVVLRTRRQVEAFAATVERLQRLPPITPRLPALPRPSYRRPAVIVAALLLAASVVADHRFGRPSDDWGRYDHRTFDVSAATTDSIRLADGTTVRLLGVADPVPAAAGVLADLHRVTLLLPTVGVRDGDGRLAAYVYPAEGGECVGVTLVRDGLAYADRRRSDPMSGLFDVAESEARRKGRGLWAGLRFDQMPAWRQAWLRSRVPR